MLDQRYLALQLEYLNLLLHIIRRYPLHLTLTIHQVPQHLAILLLERLDLHLELPVVIQHNGVITLLLDLLQLLLLLTPSELLDFLLALI